MSKIPGGTLTDGCAGGREAQLGKRHGGDGAECYR